MNNINIVYIALGIGLPTWLFFSYCYPLIKEIIRIEDTPTGQINALPLDGQIEVVGKVEGKTIYSPLTHKACVLWQIDIKQAAGGSGWITIYTEISTESIDVNDGTGKIKILPNGSYLLLRDNRQSSSLLFLSDPQIKDLMDRLDIETSDNLGINKMLRVYEHILEPEEEIYVLGEVKYESGIKTIATKESAPQIISDRSQRELLSKLYRNVISRISTAALIIFVVWWGFLKSK